MTPAERAMDEHVRRVVVDAAPPLTPGQRLELRRLLAPAPGAAAGIEAGNAEVRRKLVNPGERADVAACDQYVSTLADKAPPLSAGQREQIAAELAPVREKTARRGSGST